MWAEGGGWRCERSAGLLRLCVAVRTYMVGQIVVEGVWGGSCDSTKKTDANKVRSTWRAVGAMLVIWMEAVGLGARGCRGGGSDVQAEGAGWPSVRQCRQPMSRCEMPH